MRRDSSVGIVTTLTGLVQDSNPGKGKKFSTSPKRPDRLWGLPSVLFCGHRRSFPGLKPMLGMGGAILLLPLYDFMEWTRAPFL